MVAASAAERQQESSMPKLIVLVALALAVAVGSRKIAKAAETPDRGAP